MVGRSVPRRLLELVNGRWRFCSAMPDARTYRQFAEECLRLVKSMPQHRAMLEEMAATWQRLASAADEKQTKGGKKKDEG